MADFRVTIRGLDELRSALGDDGLIDDGLRPGMRKAGVIVEGAWKTKVHTVTRKYQGSLGHDVTGRGIGIEAHVGPQPGLGQPRKYTKAQTSRWKKPRDGVNRGDPQVYARFEDQGTRNRAGHPAAEPALEENADRIADVIADSFEAAFRKRF